MAVFTVYTDVVDFLANAASNQETASLVGGNATLQVGVSAGAQSLNVGTAQAFPTSPTTFQAWILDGPNSEAIYGCTYSGSILTIPAPGTAYPHAAGVSISSAGTAGCLASAIRDASALMETICQQGRDAGDRSLWQKSRVETLSGPNASRAHFDRDSSLVLRPYHFPVASVASVQVQVLAQTAVGIDTTYLVLPDGARTVIIPVASALGTPPPSIAGQLWTAFPRHRNFWVTLTYTGGAVAGTTLDAVPSDLRRACFFLTQDILANRRNPGGWAMYRVGDVTIEARLRGDTEGKSLLYKAAAELLEPYTRTI